MSGCLGGVNIRGMKAVALYHPKSDHARLIEEYARDFGHTNSDSIELVSLETREGAAMATLYDIVSYPALLVTDGDGRLHQVWQGGQLPLMNELAGYLVV